MKDEDGKIQEFDKNNVEEDDPIEDEKPKKIEAENTLDMLEQALGGFGPPKKKKTAKKKTVGTKKIIVDTATKFFNNYSENPHLQQIENGYL